MDSIERDDFVYALQQTMGFYGKEIDKMQVSFWVDACRDKSVTKLKKAFREHIKIGKFAPRPADILSIVDNMAQHSGHKELPAPVTTNCPPDIARAWMWFIGRSAIGTNLDGLFSDKLDISLEQQEKYLHAVNHEAHKYGMPESIPEEYKLKEVWGELA